MLTFVFMGVCHDVISSLWLVQALVHIEKKTHFDFYRKRQVWDFWAYFVKRVHNIFVT